MPKTIIITGASRGIGHAIATYLISHNHNLIVASRSLKPLIALKATAPERVEILVGDLSDLSTCTRCVERALGVFGRLDGLVLNHGVIGEGQRIADVDVQEFRRTFDANFFSYVSIIKAALLHLRESKGRIVLTSSGGAVAGYSTWGAYGSSKASINHLAMTLRAEEEGGGVCTVAVRPGVVDTEMQRELRDVHLERLDKHDQEKFLTAHKDGKLLRPEQPGHVMARLVLDAPMDLCGKFLTWNDEALKSFQD